MNETDKLEYNYGRNSNAYPTVYCGRFEQGYPKRLQEIPDPPAGIYYRGHLPSEDVLAVGIVGSRNCSAYGRWMAREYGTLLAKSGIAVISGLARGIDGVSQKAAIDAGGYTYGVLGCGVEVVYPEENRNIYEQILTQGGLISEYPPSAPPIAKQFPSRNRIISGLSDVLLVVEARMKSGTGITVSRALEQGKDVFAVPGRIGDTLSEGCNQLIAQGAGIAPKPEKFLEELAITKKYNDFMTCKEKKKNNLLEKKEKMVYATLDFYPKNLEEIAVSLKIQVPELLETLLNLQLKGYVGECGKNNYVKLQ